MGKWDIAVIGVAALGIIYLLRQTGKDIVGAVENIKMPTINMPAINIPGMPEIKFPEIKVSLPENKIGLPDIPGVTGFGSTDGKPNIPGVNYIPFVGTPKEVADKLSGWWHGYDPAPKKQDITDNSTKTLEKFVSGSDFHTYANEKLTKTLFSAPAPATGAEFHKAAWDKLAPPVPSPSLDYSGQGGGNYSNYQQPTRAPLSPRSGWTYDSLAAAIRESGLGLTQANFGIWYIPGTFVGDPVSGGGSIDTGSIYEQVKLRL